MKSEDHLGSDGSIIVDVKLHKSIGDLVHLVLRGDLREQADHDDLKQDTDHLNRDDDVVLTLMEN